MLCFISCSDNFPFEKTKSVLATLGLKANEQDCVQVKCVCSAVSMRSAKLCAAGLAAVAKRIKINRQDQLDRVTVGVDGSVYKTNPK